MAKLTLDEFCDQWVKGKWTTVMASRLEQNVFDFATLAGRFTKQEFKSNFSRGGFFGKKWSARTSRWGRRFNHPTMIDTGTLADSIQGEAERIDIVGSRADRTRIFRKGARYSIWTTEQSQAIRGKRGRKRGHNQSYAAVHNTDPKFGLYTVNQFSKRRPIHRQFIGFSPKIDNYIDSMYVPLIFKGFPGV